MSSGSRSTPALLARPSVEWWDKRSTHSDAGRDEAGAVIILALVFLVAVGASRWFLGHLGDE